ncbi:phage capsid protein [Companilactobacillus sp. RD055328]|uniref:phage capsid protein n=1 Tax=Companilactobacillus sp. RD055328 TaxID=2916634 RepID=UPI001FC8594C|nr:phage capsid protein [Companilactobacillus sp. RD055328]GKQ42917.1 phage capsid protein [Companilactobacillus sp. RD055328]
MSGENNNQSVRSYQTEFKELLQAVYQKKAYFGPFFGNQLQALDGITNNKKAFEVKTNDIPVTVGQYNKDAAIAFGAGTSNSNRFGDRTEIIYDNAEVDYSWGWSIHEGIDRTTVNADFDGAIADRLDLQAQTKIQLMDDQGAKFISKSAAETLKLADYSADSVLALFNSLSAKYSNLEVVGQKMAWVTSELYNAIVDHPLTTSAKSSSANVDENNIVNFKGFTIVETPDTKFQTGEIAYTSVVNVGRQFTGINTARTIESEDFDGVALQGQGMAGEYVLPANKKQIMKVTNSSVTPPENGGETQKTKSKK